MSKSLFYVGVDVGKDELCVAVAGMKPRMFANCTAGIKSMHAWAKKLAGNTRLHFCMEATGVYSRSVAIKLQKVDDIEVSIVNPAQIKASARAQLRRTKTDSVDARVILAFAETQKPSLWTPEPKTLQQLYELVVTADALCSELQQWRNRQHAHSYNSDLPAAVKKAGKAMQRSIARELDKIQIAIKKLVEQDEQLAGQVECLSTIKGIGEHTAVHLLAFARRSLTEYSAKALTAHAGLAPQHHISGSSVHGKSRLAKQGQKRLRKTLYMPAIVAAQHNPLIKPFYQRLLLRGKCKKLAHAACMRKLLIMARAMLKTQKPFNPELCP